MLPQLIDFSGGSAERGALLIAAPSVGLMATLVAWGWFADRFGERVAMMLGLGAGAVPLFLVVWTLTLGTFSSVWLLWAALCLTSAGFAAVNSASARLIMAWFPVRERGLAMGIRQTSQPVGVALAGAIFPFVSTRFGIGGVLALIAMGAMFAVLLILTLVPTPGLLAADCREVVKRTPDSAHPPSSEQPPYLGPHLWQTHGASALLTVGQFVMSVFGFVYLTEELAWDPIAAGFFFTVANLLAACMRIFLGWLSDRVGTRLTPLRAISWALATVFGSGAVLNVFGVTHESTMVPVITGVLVVVFVATALGSSNNGLSYTLVAEYAGHRWTGRALGIQNTVQNLVAAAVPILGATLIASNGYTLLFVVASVSAGVAALMLPRATPSH